MLPSRSKPTTTQRQIAGIVCTLATFASRFLVCHVTMLTSHLHVFTSLHLRTTLHLHVFTSSHLRTTLHLHVFTSAHLRTPHRQNGVARIATSNNQGPANQGSFNQGQNPRVNHQDRPRRDWNAYIINGEPFCANCLEFGHLGRECQKPHVVTWPLARTPEMLNIG